MNRGYQSKVLDTMKKLVTFRTEVRKKNPLSTGEAQHIINWTNIL